VGDDILQRLDRYGRVGPSGVSSGVRSGTGRGGRPSSSSSSGLAGRMSRWDAYGPRMTRKDE
jgi:hypothetical protein